MADDSNPFADPQAGYPFADPSITQARQNAPQPGIDDYNPFADKATQPTSYGQHQEPTVPCPQPAVMQPTIEHPPPYSQSAAQAATADLQRKQEELEIKAAELQRKEEELERQLQYGGVKENNFPPLPGFCPVKPCFYQDFSVDIPTEFQKVVKIVYYTWLGYVLLLFVNMIGALAALCVDTRYGPTFGVSIGYLVIFTPCSFVCWYRPLYKAFRSDSSFNFFLFFFIFFFQFCTSVLFAIGITNWGSCGWILAFDMLSHNKAVAGFIFIIAAIWSLFAAVVFLILVRVHRIYRNTGASFQKAQEEFASGVMSNKTVQQTAVNVGSAAARTATQNAFSGDNTQQSGNRF